ncbi:MAG: alpha/beta hydrolase [Rhodospirillales bacterium]|nr:alpha/beta hydrolase [Rhodospirillales bacterium]
MTMFEGFEQTFVDTGEVTINVMKAGKGPPLLLLHGYPQCHVMWHRVAPKLAEHFTVICTDLRGYGDSGKPEGDETHYAYSKRAMAEDQVRVMEALGHSRFMVAGHDRGGRVVHRMCLDHPERVTKAAVLDIAPTHTMFRTMAMEQAMGYYHWLFLAQPHPLPEKMIEADPDFYLLWKIGAWSGSDGRDTGLFDGDALETYKRHFRDPATIHASCEDYRAGATIDLVHDEAEPDAKIACPLLVLWGGRGKIGKWYDVIGTWREKSADPDAVVGRALDCGHFVPEEAPEGTIESLTAFFGS